MFKRPWHDRGRPDRSSFAELLAQASEISGEGQSGTGCVTTIPPPLGSVVFCSECSRYEYGSTAQVTVNDDDMTVFAQFRNTALHIHPHR